MSLPAPGSNEVALITGASSGIGEQFARQLAARGHRLALVARREDRLTQLAQDLGGEGRAVVIAADLGVAADRDRLAARLAELGLRVELLVNCAGYGIYAPFAESTRERELGQLHVDVEAVVDLMARYLPGMVDRRRGAVINMSSTAGFQALPYNAGYSAAKGYVLLLSEAVHAEVEEYGVTVTAVCPGPVPTGFQQASDASYFRGADAEVHVRVRGAGSARRARGSGQGPHLGDPRWPTGPRRVRTQPPDTPVGVPAREQAVDGATVDRVAVELR
jgi:uncharacterized protein